MNEPALQVALFQLAINIDIANNFVEYKDWTQPPRAPSVKVSLRENEILNWFWKPRSIQEVKQQLDISESELTDIVTQLREKNLLQSEEEWQQVRAKNPYINLPSLASALPDGQEQYSSYEQAYANNAVPWNDLPVATEMLSLAVQYQQHSLKVLEVGCGSGYNVGLIEALGMECSGIDISPTAIEKVQSISANPNNFLVGSAMELPWETNSFSQIIDIGCLHCLSLDDVHRYIAEIKRVLQPNGRFLCRTFKPRNETVLRAQPVKMDFLGYDPEQFIALFDDVFPIRLVKEAPVHCLYVGEII